MVLVPPISHCDSPTIQIFIFSNQKTKFHLQSSQSLTDPNRTPELVLVLFNNVSETSHMCWNHHFLIFTLIQFLAFFLHVFLYIHRKSLRPDPTQSDPRSHFQILATGLHHPPMVSILSFFSLPFVTHLSHTHTCLSPSQNTNLSHSSFIQSFNHILPTTTTTNSLSSSTTTPSPKPAVSHFLFTHSHTFFVVCFLWTHFTHSFCFK